MSSRPPDDPGSAAQQIEKLLARSMGPMAKIIFARAQKKGGDDQTLLNSIASYIENDTERTAFIAAAARILAADQRKRGADVTTLAVVKAVPPRDAAPPPDATTVAMPPPLTAAPSPPAPAATARGAVMKDAAVFVSYTRENLDAARRLVDALHAAGMAVWLDLGKLAAGDAWDLEIRRNIKACSYFIPLISRETEARREGYFRREWNMAAERALYFADDVPFVLPVVIDDTRRSTARVPERFRAAHWTTLPGGEATPDFIDQIRKLVDDFHRRNDA